MLRSPTQRVSSAVLIALATVAARAQEERRPVEAPPHSRVFGRVVDETGKPLAGALATLDCVGDEWAKGVELPKIKWRGFELEALQTRTGADGRFEFDVVTPTADWVSLVLEPDVYHDVANRDFGPAGGRDKPRLLAGDNDLGEFKLAATGAIAGRVLDEKSQPIAGAEVRLDSSFPGGLGRSGRSDAGGAFTIEHVPAGKYGIEALRDGFKIAKRPDVAVAIRATTAVEAIVLAIAPTISGIVVDERGQAVANAWVWGWPEQSGSGGGARTDAQGHFTVALKQADPHRFEVTAEGFAKLEEPFAFGGGVSHPVGATDVRLVLKRPVMTTFVVLDALTSKPVTRYAVALAWRPTPDGGHRSGGEPDYPLADHENGEFTCAADPALFDYVISAPGHGPAKGSVTHESATSPRCVVKLWNGASISGRVVFEGQPVAHARILLRPQSLVRMNEEDGGGPFDENDFFWMPIDGQTDPFLFDEKPRKARTGNDGRFSFENLDAKEYRLEVLEDGARRSVDPIAAFAGQPVDLGDVELIAAATLRGRVLVPEGTSPEGVGVTGYVFDQRATVKTDAQGRFEITAPSGRWHVVVFPEPGKLAYGSGPDLVYELAPNATKEIELDLRDRAGCFVRIELFAHGKALNCWRLYFASAADPARVGAINVNGASNLFAGWINALGVSDVTAFTPAHMPLGPVRLPVELTPGADVSARVEVPCGRLVIGWPEIAPGEKFTQVFCEGEVAGAGKAYPRYFVETGAPQDDVRLIAPNRCEFAFAPVGQFDWTIHVCTTSGEQEHQSVYGARFKITDGETTEVALTERDRVQDK